MLNIFVLIDIMNTFLKLEMLVAIIENDIIYFLSLCIIQLYIFCIILISYSCLFLSLLLCKHLVGMCVCCNLELIQMISSYPYFSSSNKFFVLYCINIVKEKIIEMNILSWINILSVQSIIISIFRKIDHPKEQ
jgi:hypothetical protein